LKKFREYIKESFDLELHYSAFDWDDNILHMPTTILMDQKVGDKWLPVEVSTSNFAKIRNDKDNYRLRNDEPNLASANFRDFGPKGPGVFLKM
jgi:hypothetical protein